MKKVYFLINSLEGGGAERVIANISEKLSCKYEVTIITLKNATFYDIPEHIHHIALSNIKSNLLMVIMIPYYIYKLKKLFQIHSFDSGMSSLEIANFIHILSKKDAIISFETNIRFFQGFIGSCYKMLIKILYPRAKQIKVNSEENKYDLSSYLAYDLSKINVIYNPIDFNKVEQLSSETIENDILNGLQNKQVFITVGRLIKSKYHEKIINAFSQIQDKNWIYLIVGDGPERKKLEEQVFKLGLQENIIFLGAQKNVFKYLNIANYFLYASKIEGFPNVLGEAMACDLPIITSNFISGAQECILGNYDNNLKNMKYPYYGDNGALLSLEEYEKNFLIIYSNLDKVNQYKVGFEKFSIKNIQKKFEEILFN